MLDVLARISRTMRRGPCCRSKPWGRRPRTARTGSTGGNARPAPTATALPGGDSAHRRRPQPSPPRAGAGDAAATADRAASRRRRRRPCGARRRSCRMRWPTVWRSTAQRCHSSMGMGAAGLGEQLAGQGDLIGGADMSPRAVLAAAFDTAGQEHAGGAQPGGLDEVQRADASQAGQLDQAHVLRIESWRKPLRLKAAPAHSAQLKPITGRSTPPVMIPAGRRGPRRPGSGRWRSRGSWRRRCRSRGRPRSSMHGKLAVVFDLGRARCIGRPIDER